MLTDKIHFPNPTTEPEDILSSALGVIFPDDITNQHGDPSTPIIYLSPAHGAVHLTLADPRGEDNRRLFSHFLWNAAVLLGEFMEEGEGGGGEEGGVKGKGKGKGTWDVRGLDVLEVGAGTGLGGLVACLEGARRVVVSDYPAEEVLGNITANVERNITARRKEGLELGSIEVRGHEWGVLDDGFAVENRGAFARVLVADCLWMPWQHGSLRRSIAWFLSEGGRAWVVAGFHTGREKMRGFFGEEALRGDGLVVERIWERNADGVERAWVEDRGVEDVTERKRWLVVAVLKKASG